MNALVTERRFVCTECKYVHLTWGPRCVGCSSLRGLVLVTEADRELASPALEEASSVVTPFSTPRLSIARPQAVQALEDIVQTGSGRTPLRITEIEEKSFVRYSTGLPPLDHVLGGGFVVASVVLLAAPPGTGKTSLTLQMLDGLRHPALYATGEETEVQVAGTARRVGVTSDKLFVVAESSLESIFAHARALQAQTIAIDSIQKMSSEAVNGRAGSTTQLKECTAQLVKFAKSTKTSLWLIGHVTGDGDIAGPMTIEHDVDVVLELDRGARFEGNERILNCFGKNRFGPTNVKGHFELTPKGLIAVDGDGWNEEL